MNLIIVLTSTSAEFMLFKQVLFQAGVTTFLIADVNSCSQTGKHVDERVQVQKY